MKSTFAVTGMMCAGCAANVERRLKSVEGVKAARVNLAAGTVLIDYDSHAVTPQKMKAELEKTGYGLVTDDTMKVDEAEKRQRRSLVRRVALSWLFTLLTMSVCMGWISIGDENASNQTLLIIALLNISYCGRTFYVNAWKQLIHKTASMDTLVAMSTAISFLFSVFNTFWGEALWGARGMECHTYYDASVMVITFVLTGRMLEQRAKNGTASAIKALMGLSPKTARIVTPDGKASREMPVGDIRPGYIIEVREGEKIPVDGTVCTEPGSGVSRDALIDESTITGEAEPAHKDAGDKVYAGTTTKSGILFFRAEEVGSKTVLANIISMVQQAQASKAPVQRIADKMAAVFVPAVLAVAASTFVIWWVAGGNDCLPQAIMSAVSVLVIACPCAMGLATPTALTVGIGKAAQRNILIKDATAPENMRHTNALIMDKTGTLTVYDGKEALAPHAADAVAELKQQGIDIYLMSGDKEEPVREMARQAGITHCRWRVMPQDKEDAVRELQRAGKHVAMVGDGINDTQALAAADISIAMGRGTDIAMDVAQVTLMGTDLRRIPEAIRLSRKTVATIHQNLFWAFIYNVICIPLAAGLPCVFGVTWHITPALASALMAFSSISVVLNSLRLKLSL